MPVKGKVSNRLKKRRQEESMLGAMNAAKKGSIGAALEFAVLRASLRDRISGQVIHGTSSVPNPHLSIEQEIVEYLLYCSKMGYWNTRCQKK